jgi:chemoreceptor zinc-binding protein
MTTPDPFERAIAAHAKWKFELREAIDTGKSPWAARDVRTDNACEFGKWLATLPQSQRLSEHYTKVRDLHAEFHTAAADVLELALAGRKDEAAAAIGFNSRFAVVSSNLTMAVLAWQKAPGQK